MFSAFTGCNDADYTWYQRRFQDRPDEVKVKEREKKKEKAEEDEGSSDQGKEKAEEKEEKAALTW